MSRVQNLRRLIDGASTPNPGAHYWMITAAAAASSQLSKQ
jgi:hypothetical protein